MTTIAFDRWDSRIQQKKFSDVFSFLQYISDTFTKTDLVPLKRYEKTSEIVEKMEQTKLLPKSDFVNL